MLKNHQLLGRYVSVRIFVLLTCAVLAVAQTCPSGEYLTQSTCVDCEMGFYCPGNDTRLDCPANHYCPLMSDAPVACPVNTTAPMNSIDSGDCSCVSGYYAAPVTVSNACDGGQCIQTFDGFSSGCLMNLVDGTEWDTFDGNCLATGKKSVILDLGQRIIMSSLELRLHPMLHTRFARGIRAYLFMDYVCVNVSEMQPVIDVSTSFGGSVFPTSVEQNITFFATESETVRYIMVVATETFLDVVKVVVSGVKASTTCSSCEVNHYCTGGMNRGACRANSASGPFSSSIDSCVCDAGYSLEVLDVGQETERTVCEGCPVGTYCIGNNIRESCPYASQSSSAGSTSRSQCVCAANKYETQFPPPSFTTQVGCTGGLYLGQNQLNTRYYITKDPVDSRGECHSFSSVTQFLEYRNYTFNSLNAMVGVPVVGCYGGCQSSRYGTTFMYPLDGSYDNIIVDEGWQPASMWGADDYQNSGAKSIFHVEDDGFSIGLLSVEGRWALEKKIVLDPMELYVGIGAFSYKIYNSGCLPGRFWIQASKDKESWTMLFSVNMTSGGSTLSQPPKIEKTVVDGGEYWVRIGFSDQCLTTNNLGFNANTLQIQDLVFFNSKDCASCPDNSASAVGSTSISQCQCLPGYSHPQSSSLSGVDPNQCIPPLCPAGKIAVPVEGGVVCADSCGLGRYLDVVGAICRACPVGSYCDGTVRLACPSGFTSPIMSSLLSHCVCMESYYMDNAGQCLICPSNAYKPSGNAALSACGCPPGTYGTFSGGVLSCTDCEVGNYCVGNMGAPQQCPNGWLTRPNQPARALSDCIKPVCGNSLVDPGEQCDDGNNWSGDGCSRTCSFEDITGTSQGPDWVCDVPALGRTVCSRSYLNPITGQFVTSCAGQASDNPGYTVRARDCVLEDVNECLNGTYGGCIRTAVCVNFDRVTGNTTHECRCPPGLNGDGVKRCDNKVFKTSLELEAFGLTLSSFDENVFRAQLFSANLVPPGIPSGNVQFEFVEKAQSAVRRLMQTSGSVLSIKVIIISDSQDQMNNVTTATDSDGLAVLVADLFNATTSVVSYASSLVQTIDQIFGPVNVFLSGFQLNNIVYNSTSLEWLIRVKFVETPNTLTSLYVTKAGTPPYSVQTMDTFSVSKHPCYVSSSVCCLRDYRNLYYTGQFAGDIDDIVGVDECNATAADMDTRDLFNVSLNQQYVMNALSELNESYMTKISDGDFLLHLKRYDLRDSVAVQTNIAGGMTQRFFVGMSFFTLLPANALDTQASQVEVTVTTTDATTFVTTSAQDYTFIDYITMTLFQNKFIEGGIITRLMQYVRVGFVLPRTIQQDLMLGLVPLTGIRFSIGTELPDIADTSKWVNPCYGGVESPGLYDAENTVLREMYETASAQSCAFQNDMCANPLSAMLTSRLVEFYFPIGNDTLTAEIFTSPQVYYIFIYFDVVVVDSTGKKAITKLFAQARLSQLSFIKACESVQSAQSLEDVITMDMAIGLVSKDSDWSSSVTYVHDIIGGANSYADGAILSKAMSIESGLITLALQGSPSMFEYPGADLLELDIEDMISFHFLDTLTYNAFLSLITSGNAFQMLSINNGNSLEIVLTQAALGVCNSANIGNDFRCVIRKDIYLGETVDDFYVYDHAVARGVHDDALAVKWLTENLLGVTQFATEFATNWTDIVRTRWNVNDRYNKVWYVNPGYRWSAGVGSSTQSILTLSDRTIMIGVVVLRDGTGNIRRRNLLQFDPSSGETKKLSMPSEVFNGEKREEMMRTLHSMRKSHESRKRLEETMNEASFKLLRESSTRNMIKDLTTLRNRRGSAVNERLKSRGHGMHAAGRNILQTNTEDIYKTIQQNPVQDSMPTVKFSVDGDEQIGSILNMNTANDKWVKMTFQVSLVGVLDSITYKDMRDEVQRRIDTNFNVVSPSAKNAVLTHFSLVKSSTNSRRRLLANNMMTASDWNGLISVFVQYSSAPGSATVPGTSFETCRNLADACTVFEAWTGCAFKFANINFDTNGTALTSDQLVRQFCDFQNPNTQAYLINNHSFGVLVKDKFLEKCRNYFNASESVFRSCDQVVQYMEWNIAPVPALPGANSIIKPRFKISIKVENRETPPTILEQNSVRVIIAGRLKIPVEWVAITVIGPTAARRRNLLQVGAYTMDVTIQTDDNTNIEEADVQDAIPNIQNSIMQELMLTTSTVYEVLNQPIIADTPIKSTTESSNSLTIVVGVVLGVVVLLLLAAVVYWMNNRTPGVTSQNNDMFSNVRIAPPSNSDFVDHRYVKYEMLKHS